MDWSIHPSTHSPLIVIWWYLWGCSLVGWHCRFVGWISGCCRLHPEQWQTELIWIAGGPLPHPRLQRSESSDLSPLRWQRFMVKQQHYSYKKSSYYHLCNCLPLSVFCLTFPNYEILVKFGNKSIVPLTSLSSGTEVLIAPVALIEKSFW